MTRLWPDGDLITVVADRRSRPRRFTWLGQTHEVEAIAKQWRVDLEWWRKRVYRDYFKLTTTSGLLVVLFRDQETGTWYLQRLYD